MALGAWSPFKDLHSVAQEYALHNANSSYHRLKALLRQHKPEFFSLLKNAVIFKKYYGTYSFITFVCPAFFG